MKIKFKSQPYQSLAVDAVVDCFAGQPRQDALKYTIDPGASALARMEVDGFGNAEVRLPVQEGICMTLTFGIASRRLLQGLVI